MKNKQKGFAILVIVTVVALLALGGGIYLKKSIIVSDNEPPIQENIPDTNDYIPTTTAPENIVGGDQDEHGCIGSAGYSWCEVKNKCLRVWEEKCDIDPINSLPENDNGSIQCTMDAMMCPDGSYVGRSGPNCQFVCPSSN